jgi:hypothetical protein
MRTKFIQFSVNITAALVLLFIGAFASTANAYREVPNSYVRDKSVYRFPQQRSPQGWFKKTARELGCSGRKVWNETKHGRKIVILEDSDIIWYNPEDQSQFMLDGCWNRLAWAEEARAAVAESRYEETRVSSGGPNIDFGQVLGYLSQGFGLYMQYKSLSYQGRYREEYYAPPRYYPREPRGPRWTQPTPQQPINVNVHVNNTLTNTATNTVWTGGGSNPTPRCPHGNVGNCTASCPPGTSPRAPVQFPNVDPNPPANRPTYAGDPEQGRYPHYNNDPVYYEPNNRGPGQNGPSTVVGTVGNNPMNRPTGQGTNSQGAGAMQTVSHNTGAPQTSGWQAMQTAASQPAPRSVVAATASPESTADLRDNTPTAVAPVERRGRGMSGRTWNNPQAVAQNTPLEADNSASQPKARDTAVRGSFAPPSVAAPASAEMSTAPIADADGNQRFSRRGRNQEGFGSFQNSVPSVQRESRGNRRQFGGGEDITSTAPVTPDLSAASQPAPRQFGRQSRGFSAPPQSFAPPAQMAPASESFAPPQAVAAPVQSFGGNRGLGGGQRFNGGGNFQGRGFNGGDGGFRGAPPVQQMVPQAPPPQPAMDVRPMPAGAAEQ